VGLLAEEVEACYTCWKKLVILVTLVGNTCGKKLVILVGNVGNNRGDGKLSHLLEEPCYTCAAGRIRQHTSAYVSIRQHT
jgi:hypothetical protein